MTCNEIIMSEDYADFILPQNLLGISELKLPAECTSKVYEWYHIAYAKLPPGRQLSLSDACYSCFPKLFGLMDTDSMEKSGILRVQNQPGLDLNGRGVLIGLVDTGIDYTHPAFRNPDGSTRIIQIWDQTVQGGVTPELWKYGSLYSRQDINRALQSGNPRDIVPSVDENGHGTFLAGIAAGSPEGDGSFVGAAPGASIAVVKLKPAKKYLKDFFQVKEDALAFQENDIMLGLMQLLTLANQEKMPLVLLIGLGSNQGSHSGFSPLATVLRWMSSLFQVVVVVAGGNEAGRQRHFQGTVAGEAAYQDVELRVAEGERGFSMEIWAQVAESYVISLVSPAGEVIPPLSVRGGRSSEIDFILDKTRVFVDYEIVNQASGQFLILLRFFAPTPGLWSLRIYNTAFLNGSFHIWLPIAGFAEPDTVFLQPDPYVTLTVPAGVPGAMVVSCYNHRNNSIYLFSSRGFTSDNYVKPDLAAPGVDVYGPRAGGGYTQKSGSSISAAHAAGASALLLEWAVIRGNQVTLNSSQAIAYMVRSAGRQPGITYPSREWGYGTLNLYRVFEQMAEGRF